MYLSTLSPTLLFSFSNSSQKSRPDDTSRRSDTLAFAKASHPTPNDAHRASTSADVVDSLAIGCVVAMVETLGKREVEGKTTYWRR